MGSEELHDIQLLHRYKEIPPRPPSRMHQVIGKRKCVACTSILLSFDIPI